MPLPVLGLSCKYRIRRKMAAPQAPEERQNQPCGRGEVEAGRKRTVGYVRFRTKSAISRGATTTSQSLSAPPKTNEQASRTLTSCDRSHQSRGTWRGPFRLAEAREEGSRLHSANPRCLSDWHSRWMSRQT